MSRTVILGPRRSRNRASVRLADVIIIVSQPKTSQHDVLSSRSLFKLSPKPQSLFDIDSALLLRAIIRESRKVEADHVTGGQLATLPLYTSNLTIHLPMKAAAIPREINGR